MPGTLHSLNNLEKVSKVSTKLLSSRQQAAGLRTDTGNQGKGKSAELRHCVFDDRFSTSQLRPLNGEGRISSTNSAGQVDIPKQKNEVRALPHTMCKN
jgi:hypothetical protein